MNKYRIITIPDNSAAYNTGLPIPFYPYRYLTIVCNGWINPKANHWPIPIGAITPPNLDLLYLKMPDNTEMYIDGEIHNLDLFEYLTDDCKNKHLQWEYFYFYNSRKNWIANSDYGNFTGDLKLILSIDPIDWRPLRRQPGFIIKNHNIAAGTTKTYYLGAYVDVAHYAIAVRYIPELFDNLKLMFDVDANIDLSIFAINQGNGAGVDILGAPVNGIGILDVKVQSPLMYLAFKNNDAINPHPVSVQGYFNKFMLGDGA
jgi:hypothetical protein